MFPPGWKIVSCQQQKLEKVLLYVKLKPEQRRCLSSNFELVPYASISFAVLSMDIVDWFNFANVKTMSFIFSEHIGLSWFKMKSMFYVDNNSLHVLGNATELNNLFC